jgi:hypothetical protein
MIRLAGSHKVFLMKNLCRFYDLWSAVAISMLEDQRNTYNEDYFFEFTMFNGKRKKNRPIIDWQFMALYQLYRSTNLRFFSKKK